MHRQPHLASEARGPLPSITHTNSKSTFKKKNTQDKYLAPGETQRRVGGAMLCGLGVKHWGVSLAPKTCKALARYPPPARQLQFTHRHNAVV